MPLGSGDIHIDNGSSEFGTDPNRNQFDESNKENSGLNDSNRGNGSEIDILKTITTPRRSTLGRIVEMFSPVKMSYSTELAQLQVSFQECNEERQRLACELQSQRERFEAEKRALIDIHRNEIQQIEQQLKAAKNSVSDVNLQLESERQMVNKLVGYLNQTEQLVQWCNDELHTKASFYNALRSAFETIDAIVNEFNKRTCLNGFSQENSVRDSILEDRMASLVFETSSEICDFKHTIFELEACLEQEQTQVAEFQQCIHTMEDDILELQVQRDQAVEELKKCSSAADLELARAEAELIATECMVELAVAGENLEQATNTVVSLNQQLSDVHSDVRIVTTYAESLEHQVADLVRECELWRNQYYVLAKGGFDHWAESYERVAENSITHLHRAKLRLKDEMERKANLERLLLSSETSREASSQIQLDLQREIQQARDKFSLLSRYVLTLESVVGSLVEDAKNLIDCRFTDVVASDCTDRVAVGGEFTEKRFEKIL